MPKRRGLSLILASYLGIVFALCPVLRTACAGELEPSAMPECPAAEDFCPRAQTCPPCPERGGSSCPSQSQAPSGAPCRACTLGTIEEARAAEREPQRTETSLPVQDAPPVTLAVVTVARRIDVRAASPPIHLLDATFRN